jgi:SAM (Sterile alpha motif) domain-containing protein
VHEGLPPLAEDQRMNLTEWLQSLGLERYERVFRENRIEADILPSLTVEDLKDLGVTLVGDRAGCLMLLPRSAPRCRPRLIHQHKPIPNAGS